MEQHHKKVELLESMGVEKELVKTVFYAVSTRNFRLRPLSTFFAFLDNIHSLQYLMEYA